MNNTPQQWHDFRNALEQRDFSAASALLEKNPKLIDERNSIGESVLHFLAVENNQKSVEWLHQQGADLNCTNEFGIPLLFEVAQLGYKDLVKWLMTHGAYINKKDDDGQNIEEYLKQYEKLDMIAYLQQIISETIDSTNPSFRRTSDS